MCQGGGARAWRPVDGDRGARAGPAVVPPVGAVREPPRGGRRGPRGRRGPPPPPRRPPGGDHRGNAAWGGEENTRRGDAGADGD